MNYEGEKFLLKLYRELYKNDKVLYAEKRSGKNSDNKFEQIHKYLLRLERQEIIFDGNHKNLENYLLQRYYDKYVLKEEEIPNSYFERLKQERVQLKYQKVELNDVEKHNKYLTLRENQEQTLKKWLKYLLYENKNYPMWVRYWAFQGMLKLGNYDKKNNKFNVRSKSTITNFPKLDSECLAKTIDLVINYVGNKKINDAELDELVSTGNFGKLYAYNLWKKSEKLKEKNKKLKNSNLGFWKEFKKGDAKKVTESLEGKNTEWCITSEVVCKSYLDDGKMYIYYTLDKDNNYSIPRICIRTENGFIAEIRGIFDEGQNIEPDLLDVVSKKIESFSDKDTFKKKITDMGKLTIIYNKNKNGEILDNSDLRFLYELDSKIESFGWQDDKRIAELRTVYKITDKKFAMEAVKRNGLVLEYATDEIKNDEKIVLEAVKQFAYAIRFSGSSLRENKDFLLKVVRENGDALSYFSKKFRDDRKIVLEAVKNSPFVLEYAGEKLRGDKKIVLEAVKKSAYALKYASDTLKKDSDIIGFVNNKKNFKR